MNPAAATLAPPAPDPALRQQAARALAGAGLALLLAAGGLGLWGGLGLD